MTKAFENGTGGLVLIGSSNPSAASSVSFTNLTVGKRYRLAISLLGSSDNLELHFKFRENSTDKSAGYYGAGWRTYYSGSSEIYTLNNNTKIWLLNLHTADYNSVSLDFYLNTNSQGNVIAQGFDSNVAQAFFIGARNLQMSSVNGISVFPATGTFTGKIKLYEYR